MTGPGHQHDHGTLISEARLLLDAVAARLEPFAAGAAGSGDGAGTPDDATASTVCAECGHDSAAGCTSCPICKLLAVLRGDRPELTGKLAEGALQVISGLRGLLAGTPAAAADGSTGDDSSGVDDSSTGATTSPPRPTRPVQHIDVD